MIDRILVVCQTKQESLKWVEVLRNQIKVCRTSTAASHQQQQLPQPPQQLPFHTGAATPGPTHVSSPPYLQLTVWIRHALETGDLTIDILRQILKSDYFPTSPSTSTKHFVKRHRLHKVECVIFPSREISGQTQASSSLVRRELLLDYEAENPYGFIRYFDPSQENSGGLDDDEITFLLPGARSRSSGDSSSTTSYISSFGLREKAILWNLKYGLLKN